MARGTFSASNYFRTGTALITDVPLTMACWFYQTSASNDTLVLHEANTTDIHRIRAGSGSTVTASSFKDGPFVGGTSTTGTFSLNVWNHAAGVFASSSSRTAYLNGTAATTETTNVPVPTLVRAGVGATYAGGSPLSGYLAAVGIWNVALDAAEIAALAKGFSPHLIRRASLVHHMPLIRGSRDLRGNMVEVGTVPVVVHPPIIGAIAV